MSVLPEARRAAPAASAACSMAEPCGPAAQRRADGRCAAEPGAVLVGRHRRCRSCRCWCSWRDCCGRASGADAAVRRPPTVRAVAAQRCTRMMPGTDDAGHEGCTPMRATRFAAPPVAGNRRPGAEDARTAGDYPRSRRTAMLLPAPHHRPRASRHDVPTAACSARRIATRTSPRHRRGCPLSFPPPLRLTMPAYVCSSHSSSSG